MRKTAFTEEQVADAMLRAEGGKCVLSLVGALVSGDFGTTLFRDVRCSLDWC